jgi:hypothetical protein
MNIFADENIPLTPSLEKHPYKRPSKNLSKCVLRHRQNELQGAFTTLTEAVIDIRRPPP